MRDRDDTLLVTSAADQSDLHRAHLGMVLRSLRDHGPRSRARLADELGLTRAAASRLVTELEARGLVREGAAERGGVGRPGTRLELDGTGVWGIGAEVNVDHVAVTAIDLAGDVVADARLGLDTRRHGPGEVVEVLAGQLRTTLAAAAARGAAPVGVTVGVAGLVDVREQLVTHAPNLGWFDLPLAAMLRERLPGDAPQVTLDNEATLAAIAESGPGREDMVVLYGEVGVGGGVVVDGRLLRGHHGWAGEIGHIIVDPQGRRCGCGRVGCWETKVGLGALLDAATDPDDPVRDPSLSLDDRLEQLVARAEVGDGRTLAALHQVGSWLGTGAATLVNVLNPGAVVLSGYFAVLGQWLLPAVETQLDAWVLAPRAGGAGVLLSSLGSAAAVRGASLVSLDPVFSDPTVVAAHPVPVNGEVR